MRNGSDPLVAYGHADDERGTGAARSCTGSADGLLVEVSDALDADLATLPLDDWATSVIHGWSVGDVVTHITAVHELVLEHLLDPARPAITIEELRRVTDAACRAAQGEDTHRTLERWRASVQALRAARVPGDRRVVYLGAEFGLDSIIIDRAFETWIHANDIRRVTNRSSLDPSRQNLKVMCDLAVELMPLALAAGPNPHHAMVTLNLSGPGGGSWLMPLGDGAASDIEFSVQASARELCLLLGDRLDRHDFAYTVRGDERGGEIASDLFDVAPAFARP